MTTFRTVVVRRPAGPDSLELLDLPVRDPGPGQVRVRIEAASVNPIDLAVASGALHAIGLIDQPDHTGLGWDFAGVVEAVGAGVSVPVGTRVAGIVPGFDRDFGSYAEQIVASVDWIAPVPPALTSAQATTLALNGLTAAHLVDLLGPGAGRRLLVTGAAGAVGAYVATLAAEQGWSVTGLARDHDEGFVRALGVDFRSTPSGGWDAVADGAVLQERGVALVRDGGLFVGVQPSAVPAAERGVTVTAVSVAPDAPRLATLLERAAAGELSTRVQAELPLAEAAEAHRLMAKGGVRGRYVLVP